VNKYKTRYYPPIARQAHVQGDVIVEFALDSKGDVREATIVAGHPMLRKVVQDVAQDWRFVCIDCKPGEFLNKWTVTFRFLIEGEDDGHSRTFYRFALPQLLTITTPPPTPLSIQQSSSATP
jgi:TonB family protein